MKRGKRRVVLIVQMLLIGVLGVSRAAGSSVSSELEQAGSGRLVARIYFEDRQHLDAVAGELDIWEAEPANGHAIAALGPGQRHWLESLGYRVELDGDLTRAVASAALDPRYHYFDGQHANPHGRYVLDVLREINARFPDITELIDAGDAWLADQPGEPDRDIWVLRVTNEDPACGVLAEKPPFVLAAGMHAREVATSELAIRYIRYLTSGYDGEGGYGADADVTWLVDHHVAYVLAMQNPDGHVENEHDTSNQRRKNMDWAHGCPYSRYWGVDLNRNHSFLWGCCGGSSADPCQETFRGPGPASEPETQAFQAYFSAVMADQNGPNGVREIAPSAPLTTTGIFISLHSYGDLVLWPWGFDDYGPAPNEADLEAIGQKLASYNGYEASGTIGYEVDGAIDDWTYGRFGVPSFTLEVGPGIGQPCGGFFPAYDCIDGNGERSFWSENRDAFLYAHRLARTPYLTVRGPDAQDLAYVYTGSPDDETGQLSAAITDARQTGGMPSTVAGAEYFLDAPGPDGSGLPMSPADGSWGGVEEAAVALVDTSDLSPGLHTVLVHGRNGDGNWGPFSGVFARTGHPVYLPLCAGP